MESRRSSAVKLLKVKVRPQVHRPLPHRPNLSPPTQKLPEPTSRLPRPPPQEQRYFPRGNLRSSPVSFSVAEVPLLPVPAAHLSLMLTSETPWWAWARGLAPDQSLLQPSRFSGQLCGPRRRLLEPPLTSSPGYSHFRSATSLSSVNGSVSECVS